MTLDIPLFPGYLFVRVAFRDRRRVLTVPNVVCLVGSRNLPSVISEEEISWIRRGAAQGGAAPHPVINAGERIEITGGALEGMRGILLRSQNRTRVLVSVESIARAFVVNIDLEFIKSLPCETTALNGMCSKN